MGNPLVDAAIETLRLMGVPIPPSMPYLVEMLLNEGEDVLTAIPRIVSLIETLDGDVWQVLEEIASGMASQGPVGYVQGLINRYFAPSIHIIEDIHASKSSLITTHRTMLAAINTQLTTLAPQNRTGVANGQVIAFTGDAANAMQVRYTDVSTQTNQLLDAMEQSRQIDQDLLNELQVVMTVGAIMLVITLIVMAIALVIELVFAIPTAGGTLAIGGIVDVGILGTEAELFLGAILACFIVWAGRHALLDISTMLAHPQTASIDSGKLYSIIKTTPDGQSIRVRKLSNREVKGLKTDEGIPFEQEKQNVGGRSTDEIYVDQNGNYWIGRPGSDLIEPFP